MMTEAIIQNALVLHNGSPPYTVYAGRRTCLVPQAVLLLFYINYLIKLIALASGSVPVRNLLLNLHLNGKNTDQNISPVGGMTFCQLG